MNSIMERFFGSLRREALDNFLLIGRGQIETILEEYVAFCNSQRLHQGIQQQQIPKPGELEKKCGAVCRMEKATRTGLTGSMPRKAIFVYIIL